MSCSKIQEKTTTETENIKKAKTEVMSVNRVDFQMRATILILVGNIHPSIPKNMNSILKINLALASNTETTATD
jgi:hypothetical protein